MEITKTFTGLQLYSIKKDNKLESITKDIIEPAHTLLIKKGRFVKTRMNSNPLNLNVYIEVNEDEIVKLAQRIEAQEEYIGKLKVHYLSEIAAISKKYSGEKLEAKIKKEEEKQKLALEYEAKELELCNTHLKNAKEDLCKELDELYKFSMSKGMRLLKIDQTLKVELGERFDRGEVKVETVTPPQTIKVEAAPPVQDAETVSHEVAKAVPAPVETTEATSVEPPAAPQTVPAPVETAEAAPAPVEPSSHVQDAEPVPEPASETTRDHLTKAVTDFAVAPLEGFEEEPTVVLPFPRKESQKKGKSKFKN